MPSVYEATVTMLVQSGTATSAGGPDIQSAQALADNLAEQVQTRPILSEAAAQLGSSGLDGSELDVQARRLPNTTLLRLRAQHRNPTLAMQIANTVAQVFIQKNVESEA